MELYWFTAKQSNTLYLRRQRLRQQEYFIMLNWRFPFDICWRSWIIRSHRLQSKPTTRPQLDSFTRIYTKNAPNPRICGIIGSVNVRWSSNFIYIGTEVTITMLIISLSIILSSITFMFEIHSNMWETDYLKILLWTNNDIRMACHLACEGVFLRHKLHFAQPKPCTSQTMRAHNFTCLTFYCCTASVSLHIFHTRFLRAYFRYTHFHFTLHKNSQHVQIYITLCVFS